MENYYDVDVSCISLEEGRGRFKGMLGYVTIKYLGMNSNIGLGFTPQQRVEIWNNQPSYLNKIIKIRYKTISDKGFLAWPSFRSWA